MPLYEYACQACDHQFELLIRGSIVPTCPSCGATSLERMLSLFAVSSDGTQQRSRQTLGAHQRQKSQQDQKERSHYRHDHHDDGKFHGLTNNLVSGVFTQSQNDAFDSNPKDIAPSLRDIYHTEGPNSAFTVAEEQDRALQKIIHVKGVRSDWRKDLDGLFTLHVPFNEIQIRKGLTVDGQLTLSALNVGIAMKWRDGGIRGFEVTLSNKVETNIRLTADLGRENPNAALIETNRPAMTQGTNRIARMIHSCCGIPAGVRGHAAKPPNNDGRAVCNRPPRLGTKRGDRPTWSGSQI